MPENNTTPQNPDADDTLDLSHELHAPQDFPPLTDEEFDELVNAQPDEWP
ncbi:hypothetical protein [Streptacidiphilus neutrinimicus]|nr:hypothetical protein [Streptacidiphilus neutrinimicus]